MANVNDFNNTTKLNIYIHNYTCNNVMYKMWNSKYLKAVIYLQIRSHIYINYSHNHLRYSSRISSLIDRECNQK